MTKDMAAAAEVAAETQVMRRREVAGPLNFVADLDALDAMLEADNIVARFNNPIDPDGDPIDFEMTPMTPGQYAVYYDTLLGYSFTEVTLAENTTTAQAEVDPLDAAQAEVDPLDAEQAQRLQDELAVKKYDEKLLNILESCIQNPPGITVQRLRKWDAYYIMRLHNALIGGSRPSKQAAQFPKLDTGG